MVLSHWASENRQVRWIAESWSVRAMAISRHLGLSAPPLLRRETRSLRPPSPFGEGICCLAEFLGDSWHLGCNPALDSRAKSREIVGDLRTILGRNFSRLSDSRSGLIMGEFHEEYNGGQGSTNAKASHKLPNDTKADTNTHTLYSQGSHADDVGFRNPKLDPPPVTSLEDVT